MTTNTLLLKVAALAAAVLLASACASAPDPTPTATPAPAPTPTATPVPPTPTPTPEPTAADDPARVLFRYIRAMALLSNGHYEDAIPQFNIVLRLLPDLASAHFGRGLSYYHEAVKDEEETGVDEEKIDLAMRDLDRAIELRPGYAAALRNRGMVHLSRGRVADGVADLSRAMAIYEEKGELGRANEVRAILERR